MGVDVEGLNDLLGNFDTRFINLLYQKCFDLQTSFIDCTANISQHRFESKQRFASPIDTDQSKQAMLNRIPFGSTGWVMANGDFQTQMVSQLFLDLLLPQVRTTTIAAAGICQDQKLGLTWVEQTTLTLPPADNHVHSELGSVGGLAHINIAQVMSQIIDPS